MRPSFATPTCQKRVGGKNSFGRGEWKLGFKVSLYVRAHLFKTCSSCTSECTPFCLPAANPTALIQSLVGVNSGIIRRARKSAAHGTLRRRRENAKEVFPPRNFRERGGYSKGLRQSRPYELLMELHIYFGIDGRVTNSPLTGVSLCRWWWWWCSAAAAAAAAAAGCGRPWCCCCCCCCCCSWWILCSSSELCEEELGLSTSDTPESAGLGGSEPARGKTEKHC